MYGETVYYPFAPQALYQAAMNITFLSGRFNYYQEQPGYSANGVYNGVLGLNFERTEKYIILASADGKKLRKLNYRTKYVGQDITGSSISYKCYLPKSLSYRGNLSNFSALIRVVLIV